MSHLEKWATQKVAEAGTYSADGWLSRLARAILADAEAKAKEAEKPAEPAKKPREFWVNEYTEDDGKAWIAEEFFASKAEAQQLKLRKYAKYRTIRLIEAPEEGE